MPYSTLSFPQEGVPEDLLGSIEAAEATVGGLRYSLRDSLSLLRLPLVEWLPIPHPNHTRDWLEERERRVPRLVGMRGRRLINEIFQLNHLLLLLSSLLISIYLRDHLSYWELRMDTIQVSHRFIPRYSTRSHSESLADASAVFSESAPLLECNTRGERWDTSSLITPPFTVLPLGYSLLLGSLLLLLSASIGILAMIIYRQRKLLKNPIL